MTIIELYVLAFVLGAFCGVLYRINKKILFGVWLFAIIGAILSEGRGANLAKEGISNWHWFGIMPVFWLGNYLGEMTTNELLYNNKK